jgi:G3E family GTPase
MESGCLCCTLRGDFVVALEDLLRRRDNGRITPFRRVVVETTGLADPAPMIATVLQHPYLSRRFSLDGVITVVDAAAGLATLAEHEEALRQAALADVLVLTKTDTPEGAAGSSAVRAALAELNPGARQLEAAAGEAPASALIGLGLYDLASKPSEVEAWLAIAAVTGQGASTIAPTDAPADAPAAPTPTHGSIRQIVLTADSPVRSQTLDLFWSLLVSTHGPKLLRLKGLIDVAEHPGRPLVLHAARAVMHPPEALPAWPCEEHRTRIVLIAREVEPAQIIKLWAAFLGQS